MRQAEAERARPVQGERPLTRATPAPHPTAAHVVGAPAAAEVVAEGGQFADQVEAAARRRRGR
ncbi:hypothetical protein ACFSTC_28610 [Nonomuraea ferruginea]